MANAKNGKSDIKQSTNWTWNSRLSSYFHQRHFYRHYFSISALAIRSVSNSHSHPSVLCALHHETWTIWQWAPYPVLRHYFLFEDTSNASSVVVDQQRECASWGLSDCFSLSSVDISQIERTQPSLHEEGIVVWFPAKWLVPTPSPNREAAISYDPQCTVHTVFVVVDRVIPHQTPWLFLHFVPPSPSSSEPFGWFSASNWDIERVVSSIQILRESTCFGTIWSSACRWWIHWRCSINRCSTLRYSMKLVHFVVDRTSLCKYCKIRLVFARLAFESLVVPDCVLIRPVGWSSNVAQCRKSHVPPIWWCDWRPQGMQSQYGRTTWILTPFWWWDRWINGWMGRMDETVGRNGRIACSK